MKALNDNAHPLESLLQQHCPNGVEFKPLGEVIERVRRKVKNLNNVNVYSVSNSQGLILSTDFRDRKLYSEDISNYTLIQKGEFAYNPARLNIGSIAFLTDEVGAVSPMYVVFKIDEKSLNQKFLFYFLKSPTTLRKIVSLTETGARFRFDFKRWEKFPIPLPPLEIQSKIVEILDTFTELEAELEARLKQYHYYRNKLLSHDELENRTAKSRNDSDPATLVPYVRLGEACEILDNLRKPITKSKRTQGIYPYYGANGIQDYVNEYIFDGDFLLMGEDGSVINKDNSPVLNWVSGKFWVNNHAHILKEKSNTTNLRFVFFYLQTCDVSSIVRGVPPKINQQNLKTIQIPLPPLAVQNEIVELLDKFDTLTNDLTSGIPAEIEARKKQYEYYRERLLSFIAKD
ncbi:restriction endonuclease subunit S [Campylobacter upsaliensis]|uniref:Restriction endonuclease subunit S n=2 Tax=Campylobacter upsaliensis TaxID=28080 RepID=A0A5L8ZAN5_CAMUP|nr:restriction endonuclease subunit S [Campylobacter upsaliensis]EAH6863107.1 restriction endonuclease subunit S [Campylobacter upsaliensis]EAL8904248.1 restriction endonuclease subunit S [Campylobacter upsaliensis]EGF3200678.1 restriction endonuclease subunit S [Campylobacter upsaliensis]EHE9212134.1 restriction endonuclease subunit S [Campylobacter upsaliensis]